MALLTRLARQSYRRISEDSLGMKLKSYGTLSTLAELGDMPQSELSLAMCIDANNLVLLLNELEALGYVSRQRDPADRRRHIVVMTDDGREALLRAEQQMEATEDDVLAHLNAKERDRLHRLLKQALDG